ncbi:MAG: dihydrofolate reductase family protein [Candidatus Heteroscillospira sp.]
MRKVVLYIGMSLDGYIAGTDGSVNWMSGQDDCQDDMDAYSQFIRDVDTVIMGWNTYRQITAELSPGLWPYEGLTAYVVTHRNEKSAGKIKFTNEAPCGLVHRLKGEEGKAIWICGGADVAGQLMRAGLIDRYDISILPTMLGGGISLFGNLAQEQKLRLVESRSSNGIAELIYERR